jgi:hypothetical protein
VFGVTTMERKGSGWTMTLRDPKGAPLITCAIAGATLSCAP